MFETNFSTYLTIFGMTTSVLPLYRNSQKFGVMLRYESVANNGSRFRAWDHGLERMRQKERRGRITRLNFILYIRFKVMLHG